MVRIFLLEKTPDANEIMWPSTDEYYSMIQSARYRPYRDGDGMFKKYIDISVGFYAGCSYHPTAWEETFRTLRQHYPTEPIVLFEDGQPCGIDYSDMARRYNCEYVKEKKSLYLFWPNPEQCWQYLQWILKAAEITQTEWLIQLHPDNICNDRIYIPPPGPLCGVSAGTRTGISGNQYPEKAKMFLMNMLPDLEQNGYGWAGGGCIHVPTFKSIMQSFTYDDLLTIIEKIDKRVTLHEDIFLPFLFNYYGYPYRVWLEIEEPERGISGWGSSAAFQHGNKSFYQGTKTISVLSKKIMEEVNTDWGSSFYYKRSDMD